MREFIQPYNFVRFFTTITYQRINLDEAVKALGQHVMNNKLEPHEVRDAGPSRLVGLMISSDCRCIARVETCFLAVGANRSVSSSPPVCWPWRHTNFWGAQEIPGAGRVLAEAHRTQMI
jgi:hypothetical protein